MDHANVLNRKKYVTKTFPVNLGNYLDSTSLSLESIVAAIGSQYDRLEQALFVSTVVSGLASSHSDIDVYLMLEEQDESIEHMVTHIYLGERRVGVKTFDSAKVQNLLNNLRSVEGKAFHNIHNFDLGVNIVMRDLYRIVLGVTVSDNNLPFLDYLGSLSVFSFWDSLNKYREFTLLALLSYNSREKFAPHAYLMQAAVQLLNLTMASYADVHGNSKWIIHRWREFREKVNNPWIDEVDVFFRKTVATFSAQKSIDHDRFGADSIELYEKCLERYNLTLNEDRQVFTIRKPLGDNVGTLLPGMFLGGIPEVNLLPLVKPNIHQQITAAMGDIGSLDADSCCDLLMYIRNGMLGISLQSSIMRGCWGEV